ncbi:MAG: DUF1003 domain-containing protein [Chthonomonas sp.]|nr:DUF1003 domain-containing protein [Chthonomonas sp.]
MDPFSSSPLYQANPRPAARNVNDQHDEAQTAGQRLADGISSLVGSWWFIGGQSLILTAWIVFNVRAGKPFDPFPFILLNLILSFQAAYTGPVVMMSQNRQAEKDRLVAHNDYEVNVTAGQEICMIMEHLKVQDKVMLELLTEIQELRAQVRPQA